MGESWKEFKERQKIERAKRIENTAKLLAGFIKENFDKEQADELLDILGADKDENKPDGN